MNLLVYGTLKRGYGNHHLMKGAKFVDCATLHGHCIYSLSGFPGAEKHDGAIVRGELFEIDPDTHLEGLDRLEGFDPEHPSDSMYVRTDVNVFRDGGTYDDSSEGTPTQVYLFNSDKYYRHGGELKIIEDGIWPEKR